ncbi:MAG TPA: hypothetical protein VFT72_08140 [Opitutaceae bacterium]|nr:hypothetical protein [Opitutaceae bacterium]
MNETQSVSSIITHSPQTWTKAFWKPVLVYTAIAGTLDITAAHLHVWAVTGKFPTSMLKAIAGGAIGGQRAMEGGAGMMALGLFFHYFISFAFTLLFFLLYPRIALLRKNLYAIAPAYALFTWAVMTYIVLPLSRLPWRAPNFANKHVYIGWIILTAIFALPIVFGARRHYAKKYAD